MENKVTFLTKLQREAIPGINLFELVLFSISSVLGTILFLLTLFIWSDGSGDDLLINILSLIDLPIGILAATFLAKRSKLAPAMLFVDALLYGGANMLAGQYALGIVNFIITPILYMIAFFWIWPKEQSENGKEVITRKLNLFTGLIISGIAITFAIAFGVTMTVLGDATNTDGLPNWVFLFKVWFDSFAAALMLIAVVASVFKFREAWYFYFTSNVLKIVLFTTLVACGDLGSIELLLLAVTYFINALFGMLIWSDSKVVELKKTNENKTEITSV